MNLVQLAGMLPRDATFRAYLCDLASVDDVTTETAEIWVRTICEVESRRELATDLEAAHRFETLVRRPFVAWRRQQEVH
ncbi:hypothetical protein [Burkholderia gladioli]|uniref:hypothetical protein n=1 Tax=Burkholderia gladioli TaxID=28095 RepID=UPI001C5D7F5A|nr:hypothetical protein [Burkholderia gladioli]MBW5285958.1 hypothetical protein [Burkholderia gladioli]